MKPLTPILQTLPSMRKPATRPGTECQLRVAKRMKGTGEADPEAAAALDPAKQRRTRRHAISLPVVFVAGEHTGYGHTSDISLGGMFIETDAPVAFGEHVVVKFNAGGLDLPHRVPAVVRWVIPGRGMGLQFETSRPLVVWSLQQEIKKLGEEATG